MLIQLRCPNTPLSLAGAPSRTEWLKCMVLYCSMDDSASMVFNEIAATKTNKLATRMVLQSRQQLGSVVALLLFTVQMPLRCPMPLTVTYRPCL